MTKYILLWLAGTLLVGCGSEDTRASAGTGGSGSLTGSGGAAGAEPCARFVVSALDHEFGPGQNVGQAAFPAPILGPPKGAGETKGSLDVVALGNGGHVTLAFGGTRIVNGPGPDFIVFENAFWAGGDPNAPFAELGTVEVSADATSWSAFECAAKAAPFGSCAGWHPVYANAESNEIDPLDPSVAGGDAFDLEAVGLSEARYVRITDRPDLEGLDGVFDLDAVGIVNAACP